MDGHVDMKLAYLVVVVCVACVRLPYVAPQLRTVADQTRTLATVAASCTSPDPMTTPGLLAPRHGPRIEWWTHLGHGVVVDERHVLTAWHVIGPCPFDREIIVTLYDGREFTMELTDEWRDHDVDLARLEIASGSRFKLHVAPPIIGRLANHYVDRPSHPGDSGSPVYDAGGALLGLITSSVIGGGSFARSIAVAFQSQEGR